jgi:hypothetical protein
MRTTYVSNGSAERFALLGIGSGLIKRTLGQTHSPSCNRWAAREGEW